MRFYTKQHKFYCGIDLHARSMYLCIMDQAGTVLVHKDIAAQDTPFLDAVEPYTPDIVVGVECIFTWYWLADLCFQMDIPFVLGHALYMKAIHGGKAKNDRIDAYKIASLLRGGLIPYAYVYPGDLRPTRDLLRRRTHLVRHRAQLLAHIQNTNSQYALEPFEHPICRKRFRKDVPAHFPDPMVRKSVEADLTLIETYDALINDLELNLLRQAKLHDPQAVYLLQSVPGIGKVLSMTLLYEVHQIARFPSVKDFASYCRLVKCHATSGGKMQGTQGAKIGNAHLKWAFSEAAVGFLHRCPDAQRRQLRLVKKHGKGKAMGILAHKQGPNRLLHAEKEETLRPETVLCKLNPGPDPEPLGLTGAHGNEPDMKPALDHLHCGAVDHETGCGTTPGSQSRLIRTGSGPLDHNQCPSTAPRKFGIHLAGSGRR